MMQNFINGCLFNILCIIGGMICFVMAMFVLSAYIVDNRTSTDVVHIIIPTIIGFVVIWLGIIVYNFIYEKV